VSIANKYRPSKFSEVIGQNISVRIMINSILMCRVQSMLLSGMRGVGKTTLARLYGKALNCDNFMQLGDICNGCTSCVNFSKKHQSVMEYDAASNNSVDDIRKIESLINQVPIYKYNVVILDECHMLSKSAQNALLKALEEPNRSTIFLLVTTNPDKLIATVRSRCLSMPLRALSPVDVGIGVRRVLDGEEKDFTAPFVDSLAARCDGSLRDTYQILEQLIIASHNSDLDISYLEESVGIISVDRYKDLAAVLCAKDLKFSLEEVERWYREGVDLQYLFLEGIPNLLRDFAVYLSGAYSKSIYYKSGISHDSLKRNLTSNLEDVSLFSNEWENIEHMMRESSNSKIMWEVYFINVFKSMG